MKSKKIISMNKAKRLNNYDKMNKAYAKYFKANHIDFEFNGGIAMITKNIVKDDTDYLNALEQAYANMEWQVK